MTLSWPSSRRASASASLNPCTAIGAGGVIGGCSQLFSPLPTPASYQERDQGQGGCGGQDERYPNQWSWFATVDGLINQAIPSIF
jgi:hypothetical protein